MKKYTFLAPLAVSIAALIGGTPTTARASVEVPQLTAVATAAASRTLSIDQFVLGRSQGNALRQADHESHVSHESHSSHSSHTSHVSGS